VREHDLTITGDFPHNTSGGQLSAGQAGAAGGYLGLVEAIRQVTGQAGGDPGRQSAHGHGVGFRHDQLRPGPVLLGGDPDRGCA
jgi:acetyl-CoA acetyltransferase